MVVAVPACHAIPLRIPACAFTAASCEVVARVCRSRLRCADVRTVARFDSKQVGNSITRCCRRAATTASRITLDEQHLSRKISKNRVAQIFRNSYNYDFEKHVARFNATTPRVERLLGRELFSCSCGACSCWSPNFRTTNASIAETFVRRTYCGQEAKGCQEGGWSKEGREEEEERKEEEPLALSLAPPDADLTVAAWPVVRIRSLDTTRKSRSDH